MLKKVVTKALKFGYEIFLGAFAQIVTERHEVSHYFKILKGLAFPVLAEDPPAANLIFVFPVTPPIASGPPGYLNRIPVLLSKEVSAK